jgi:hypothetical protein
MSERVNIAVHDADRDAVCGPLGQVPKHDAVTFVVVVVVVPVGVGRVFRWR